jgi:hypothetical protein
MLNAVVYSGVRAGTVEMPVSTPGLVELKCNFSPDFS